MVSIFNPEHAIMMVSSEKLRSKINKLRCSLCVAEKISKREKSSLIKNKKSPGDKRKRRESRNALCKSKRPPTTASSRVLLTMTAVPSDP